MLLPTILVFNIGTFFLFVQRNKGIRMYFPNQKNATTCSCMHATSSCY
ncbi:hypothetical protein [Chitinophaga sp.]